MSIPSPHLNLAERSRADRLLRASVSAYCSLTRPGRQDAVRLQDLALPLLDDASRETLRYVSAALSLCETEPEALVRRIADMPVDIAAPLLGRATSLGDIDLIQLIGRHGLPHARVVASRQPLHPSIRQLTEIVEARNWRPANAAPEPRPEAGADEADLVEETRERLRAIMRATREEAGATDADIDYIYEDLRDSALSGDADRLAASIANALGILVPLARAIVQDASCSMLVPALRAIGLSEEQGFLIASAAFPLRFPNADAIRSFLRTYRAMPFEQIEAQLTRWQETGATVRSRQSG